GTPRLQIARHFDEVGDVGEAGRADVGERQRPAGRADGGRALGGVVLGRVQAEGIFEQVGYAVVRGVCGGAAERKVGQLLRGEITAEKRGKIWRDSQWLRDA